ncbi:MAG TPA: uracil-DNA glycosylase [Burkholderiales bacterium]|jgi:DNA polymerase|nr:uracil-DNA glycosylase [Burkholderiales bacterium]
MSRRSEVLAEMGLAPVWKLRAPAQPPAAADSGAAQGLEGSEARAGRAGIAEGSREERIARMEWPELKAAVKDCTACGLRAGCTQTVFGVGDESARWLLVGEAPGAEEDRLGEPFVGQAGKLLDNMLAAIGLARGKDVYIANVLKCRPPGNRNPEPEEVAKCSPFLVRQVELIRPQLILAMGRFAVQTLLNTDATIGSLRGTVHQYHGVPLIVTYHPAYLLRNLPDKAKAWADLRFARKAIAQR